MEKIEENKIKLIVFEFFSGIGGMHESLNKITNIKICMWSIFVFTTIFTF